MTHEAEVVQLLQHIAALLETLPERMRRPAAASPLTAKDRATLRQLLPAIFASVGASVWVVRDLFDHAQRDDALRAAIGDVTPRSLGRLLARAEGVVVEGRVLYRGDEVREGRLWSVDCG